MYAMQHQVTNSILLGAMFDAQRKAEGESKGSF